MEYESSYIKLFQEGFLKEKADTARKHLEKCALCPHECGVNRKEKPGFCKASDKVLVSSYGPHFGEEAELVGTGGSGTIFFGYCNLRCVFCQNYELSFGGEGELISNESLAEIMLKLQDYYKCHNINLVTPTHFVPNILEALYFAAAKGLKIPLVYNCGGYERLETLRLLEGVIDIYMPDFKYNLEERGRKYSGVKDYPEHVKQSLKEMHRQVGGLKVDRRGIAYKGLIIRHLMMPGGLVETKEILDFIAKELCPDCLVNIMDQYYPAHRAHEYVELNQRVSGKDWKEAVAYAKKLGLRLGVG
ncbi:MAG: radical SAM protein [Eubacteriales bacterium]